MGESSPATLEKAGLLRRRRRWRLVLLIAVGLLVSLSIADRLGAFRWLGGKGYGGDDYSRFDQKSFVIQFVGDDGAIRVIPVGGGEPTPIRLWGVYVPDETRGEWWGKQAVTYIREHFDGRRILVRLDGTQSRDREGRLLVHAYLLDDQTLNAALVEAGQAYADRRFSYAFEANVEAAETRARKKKAGLWDGLRTDQQPEWRREWFKNKGGAEGAP